MSWAERLKVDAASLAAAAASLEPSAKRALATAWLARPADLSNQLAVTFTSSESYNISTNIPLNNILHIL